VKMIFSMAAEGHGCTAIARTLNAKGFPHDGRPWTHQAVHDVVKNPKYAGCNVWNRHTQRLRVKISSVDPNFWVQKHLAFTPLVDQETFDRAQDNQPTQSDFLWPSEAILRRVRRLLKAKGRLCEDLILKARGMPCCSTIRNRFGNYRELYRQVGYKLPAANMLKAEYIVTSMRLRRDLGLRRL